MGGGGFKLTHWSTASLQADGIFIHYTRTGGSKPPVILLHGLAADGPCWTPVARLLEGEYDVIMPDSRGHGKSSIPDYGYRYEDLSNDVVALIEALKLASPILIGHSMGGMTAAVVASRHPKLHRSLILADPTLLSPKAQREVRDSGVVEEHRRDLNRSINDMVAEVRFGHPDRSLEMAKRIAGARLRTSMAAYDVLTPPYPDYMQLVSSIEVPTLLVIGDSHSVVSRKVASELQRVNPRVQVEQIPGAGHGLPYDQPERFAALVKSFLGAVGAAIAP